VIEKPEGKREIGRPKGRMKYDIKINRKNKDALI
jgi:hypothetical protein